MFATSPNLGSLPRQELPAHNLRQPNLPQLSSVEALKLSQCPMIIFKTSHHSPDLIQNHCQPNLLVHQPPRILPPHLTKVKGVDTIYKRWLCWEWCWCRVRGGDVEKWKKAPLAPISTHLADVTQALLQFILRIIIKWWWWCWWWWWCHFSFSHYAHAGRRWLLCIVWTGIKLLLLFHWKLPPANAADMIRQREGRFYGRKKLSHDDDW